MELVEERKEGVEGGGGGVNGGDGGGVSIYPLICKKEKKTLPLPAWWQSGDKVIVCTCTRP